MKPDYQEYLQRVSAYNRWETKERRNLTARKRLDQFLVLYDLNRYFSAEQKERFHREHLEGLIEIQKLLMKHNWNDGE
ncbi:MAG: hypothetical protein L6422_08405 [Candidatus Marinimicrobia bacterium]|nr:hypothetical protein [bacterium]MCG2716289.1 hypothetical protein [Candidatus Neomarinimicrobiota bacterium]